MAPIVPLDSPSEKDSYPDGFVEVVCPTIRPLFATQLADGLFPYQVRIHDGAGATNFSTLCNNLIDSSSVKYLVIANDKARPKPKDLVRMLKLLEDGYGLVGLYRFGFFGFNRDLMQAVGKFDENYSDGGFEDNDMILRFKFLNLAVYLSEEIDYVSNIPSKWGHVESRRYFHKKFRFAPLLKIILIDSTRFPFHAKKPIAKSSFRPWRDSVISPIPLETYSSDFNIFLERGTIVDSGMGEVLTARLQLSLFLKNLKYLFRPNPRYWKVYKK